MSLARTPRSAARYGRVNTIDRRQVPIYQPGPPSEIDIIREAYTSDNMAKSYKRRHKAVITTSIIVIIIVLFLIGIGIGVSVWFLLKRKKNKGEKCTTDKNCKTGLVCSAGTCLVPGGGVCSTMSDCVSGQICSEGVCKTPV